MSNDTCAYCDEPRGGYPDRDTRNPGLAITKSGSEIDMSGCQELLSPAPPNYRDSELCKACHKARNGGGNDAGKLIFELDGAIGRRKELSERLCSELRALKEQREGPGGQAAFDGYLSVVLRHCEPPKE